MTEKTNPETLFITKIYTFEYYVKFSFWVSLVTYALKSNAVEKIKSREHSSIPTRLGTATEF